MNITEWHLNTLHEVCWRARKVEGTEAPENREGMKAINLFEDEMEQLLNSLVNQNGEQTQKEDNYDNESNAESNDR